MKQSENREGRLVEIRVGPAALEGSLVVPPGAEGIVVFAHGSGSSRHSPRNRFVASALADAGLATLLFDLLTADEDETDQLTRRLRFDIDLLAERLGGATDWLSEREEARGLGIGYFGASTGSAAALIAAAERADRIKAVVSRGGRPDLAEAILPQVKAPTLLIVGGNDPAVIQMNQGAMAPLTAETTLEIVPGATHLFEEPGALEEVARLAQEWFLRHLTRSDDPGRSEP